MNTTTLIYLVMTRGNRVWLTGALLVIIMWAGSVMIRQQDYASGTGSRNLEASYHTLLTVTALNERPSGSRQWLPIVSLGGTASKSIPLGDTVPTGHGNYVYTSFTPPGFIAPYLWFKMLHLAPTTQHLAYFNSVLGLADNLLIFMLVYRLLTITGARKINAVGSAVIASVVVIFSREALTSTGLIYWSQSLYEPILVLSIYVFLQHLASPRSDGIHRTGLIGLVLLGALTEWTGYLSGIGLIILLRQTKTTDNRILANYLVGSLVLSALTTTIWYAASIGLIPTLLAFSRRFLLRSTLGGSFADLMTGYVLSYGLFLPLLVGIFIHRSSLFSCLNYVRFRPLVAEPAGKIVRLTLIAACFPLLENLLMLEHASQFSYDRLKFTVPSAMIIGLVFSKSGSTAKIVLVVTLYFAAVNGIMAYKIDNYAYKEWFAVNAVNIKVAESVLKLPEAPCAVYSSNSGVRGYETLLFHHGIYENKAASDADSLIAKRAACADIFIETHSVFTDMPAIDKIVIIRPDKSQQFISGYLPSVTEKSMDKLAMWW